MSDEDEVSADLDFKSNGGEAAVKDSMNGVEAPITGSPSKASRSSLSCFCRDMLAAFLWRD